MDGANKKRQEVRLGYKSVGGVVARAQSERSHRDLLEISVEGSDGREDGVVKANKITLSSGREVRLRELTQRLTCEGLIEGLPTTRMNKSHLDSLVAKYRAKGPTIPFYLVTPVETPIEWLSEKTYPFGSPAALPGVTCIGRFRSLSTGEHDPLCYSELTIIWLQCEFATPIDASVLEEIVGLDWDALASDFEI